MHHTASGWGHAIVQTQKSLPDAIAKERLLDSSAMPTLPPGGAEERETPVRRTDQDQSTPCMVPFSWNCTCMRNTLDKVWGVWLAPPSFR